MLAVVLPVVGSLLLAVGPPEALRGQVPVVRAVLEPAAAAPGVVVAEDEILELLPGVAVVVKGVEAVVLAVVAVAVAVLANQPPSNPAHLPSSIFHLSASKSLPSPSSFPLQFP